VGTILRIIVVSVGLVVCLTAFVLFTFDNIVTFLLMAATLALVGYVAFVRPDRRSRERPPR
jgi:hypothetical protein